MKVLVIPDVHLKPWIFTNAAIILKKMMNEMERQPKDEREAVGAVILGDLADDFDKQEDVELYAKTFDSCIEFLEKFPNTFFCIGNHDISYVWGKVETGYSFNSMVQEVVRNRMEILKDILKDRLGFLFCVDNVLFSHAGLSIQHVLKYMAASQDIGSFISWTNRFTDPKYQAEAMSMLWKNESPIWARMQTGWWSDKNLTPYSQRGQLLQVVGHTPLEKVTLEKNRNLLSVDVFSTRPNGKPIGKKTDQRFVIVDTVHRDFELVEYELCKPQE